MGPLEETDSGAARHHGAPSPHTWAALCHVSAVAGWLLNLLWFPLGQMCFPLATWLGKRELTPFVDVHGREALNFHVSVSLYAYGLVVAKAVASSLLRLPQFLEHAPRYLVAAACVISVVAAARAWKGHLFRYPLSIRFI
jgi:uncharacterized Tic20 family protein